MDTLVDNRKFPPEMYAREPEIKEPGKSIPWLLIFLIAFAIAIIAYLAYHFFFTQGNIVQNERVMKTEERTKAVKRFTERVKPLTKAEREAAISSFLGN